MLSDSKQNIAALELCRKKIKNLEAKHQSLKTKHRRLVKKYEIFEMDAVRQNLCKNGIISLKQNDLLTVTLCFLLILNINFGRDGKKIVLRIAEFASFGV